MDPRSLLEAIEELLLPMTDVFIAFSVNYMIETQVYTDKIKLKFGYGKPFVDTYFTYSIRVDTDLAEVKRDRNIVIDMICDPWELTSSTEDMDID